jgi:hypothetical protein
MWLAVACGVLLAPVVDAVANAVAPADTSWAKGLDLVAGGKLRKGLALLSHDASSWWNADSARARALAQISARCFLPDDTSSYAGLGLREQLDAALRVKRPGEDADPVAAGWRVLSRGPGDSLLPSFVFSAQYDLRPTPHLRLRLAGDSAKPRLKQNLAPQIAADIIGPLLWDPRSKPRRLDVGMLIDCSGERPPLEQYARDLVYDRFDEVALVPTSAGDKAVWLRCRISSGMHNVPGQTCIFVVFDRVVRSSSATAATTEKVSPRPEPLTVRYVVAAQASEAIEDRAESAVAELVRRFGLRVVPRARK